MSDLETSSPKLGGLGVMLDGLRRSQSDVNLSTGQYYSDSPAHRLLRARPSGMIRSLSASPRPASPAPGSPLAGTPRSRSPIPQPAPTNPRRPRRRRVLLALAALLAVWYVLHSARDTLVLLRFKLRDRMYEEGWVGCGLRKRPVVFVRGGDEVAVVFESNCEGRFGVQWGAEVQGTGRRGRRRTGKKGVANWAEAEVRMIKMDDDTNTHYSYSAILPALEHNTHYAYTIIRLPDPAAATSKPARPSLLASHSFPWLTSAPPTTPSGPATLHFAALADNQFNVRTFHRVLLALLKHGRTRHRLGSPPLVLHAGDQVQNPHNLAQWQTDFWEAITSFLPVPLGQTTPILQARGNHDWDKTGVNAYVGGTPPRREWLAASGREDKANHVGTYMSYSPHERVRVLVLDSNLDEADQVEQEDWLRWELGRTAWKEASLRIVMVHVAPFLEFWDRKAWTEGGESQWSAYVRNRLAPLLSQHHATLVLSGHQHAYSRGFLPAALHRAYAAADHAADLPALAKAAAAERAWEKKQRAAGPGGVGGLAGDGLVTEGTIYTIFGGAGGTLDEDRVEEWGFYERSVRGRYHFGWAKVEVGGEVPREGKRKGEKGVRVYEQRKMRECRSGEREVVDRLEWEAVAVEGDVMDRFVVEARACARVE